MEPQDDHRRLCRLLAELRATHPDIEDLFRFGQCYALWKIVRTVFPGAECLYSMTEGHVYIRLDGRLYDIRGHHLRGPADLEPLDHRRGDRPHRWGKRDMRSFNVSRSVVRLETGS